MENVENLSVEKKLELANKQVLDLIQKNKASEDEAHRLRTVVAQLEETVNKVTISLSKNQELLVKETALRIDAEKRLQGQVQAAGFLGHMLHDLTSRAAAAAVLTTKKERGEKAFELLFELARLKPQGTQEG